MSVPSDRAASAPSGPRSPVPGTRPLVIGHRGFPARYPDNTLAGVRAAIAAGADGVEVDVRPCADGTWVCHHDRARAGRAIAAWPRAELEREAVPTLAAVVAALPAARWLFVEVKPLPAAALGERLEELAALLAARATRTRFLSSSLPVLGTLECELPGVARSWVFDTLPEWLPRGVELSPKHTLVEELVGQGYPLHPWTVNHAARLRSLARLGVASLTTNQPDLVLDVLGG